MANPGLLALRQVPGMTRRAKYGHLHQRLRAKATRDIARAGSLPCVRCGDPIYAVFPSLLISTQQAAGQRWHVASCTDKSCFGRCWIEFELDHDDTDSRGIRYNGAAHRCCNRRAGGRKAHGRPDDCMELATRRPLTGPDAYHGGPSDEAITW